jgi:hypothetical protein
MRAATVLAPSSISTSQSLQLSIDRTKPGWVSQLRVLSVASTNLVRDHRLRHSRPWRAASRLGCGRGRARNCLQGSFPSSCPHLGPSRRRDLTYADRAVRARGQPSWQKAGRASCQTEPRQQLAERFVGKKEAHLRSSTTSGWASAPGSDAAPLSIAGPLQRAHRG